MPYMYILAAVSLFYFLDYFKNKCCKAMLIALVCVSFLVAFHTTYGFYKDEFDKNNAYGTMQNKLENVKPEYQIWVSNPVIAASSDNKINKLMYYPVFNQEKKQELIGDSKNADYIFLDSCDLACKPLDFSCENSRNEIIDSFKEEFKITYTNKIDNCWQYVFQNRIISLS